ncbi:hypothetical protein AcW2_006479 [Taiwanofungus camphoratus]|nr:hypothetical protein AcW2_006479 [Antrodia cinnamomea]
MSFAGSRLPCTRPRYSCLKSARALRAYSSKHGASPTPSRHAQFYSDLVPGMIPIALLGSAIYLGLRLLQANLAHEKYLDEARQRVRELEAEVDALQREQTFKSTTEPQLQVREHHKPRWWFW